MGAGVGGWGVMSPALGCAVLPQCDGTREPVMTDQNNAIKMGA
jgi:hypothetical protein